MGSSPFVFASQDQLVSEFCSRQKELQCPEWIATHIAPIEKRFLVFKQSLLNKPYALVTTKVQQVIQLTEKTEETQIEEIKTRYLHWRLQQRQIELREKINTISLSPWLIRSLRKKYVDDDQFLHAVRQKILPWLISQWFLNFVKKPYGENMGLYVDIDWQFLVDQITTKDDLDVYLSAWWKKNKHIEVNQISLYVSPKDVEKFSFVYLFKNKEDLDTLWYLVVSNRERKNTDVENRRFNIKTAFEQIWPVRVLMPWETISFLEASHFDMQEKKLYKRWKVIASDEEVDDYWGGLCGAATAIYQGVVTNVGLGIKMKNHSKRYRNLYTATIDGQHQKTPGIDATIYFPSLDLVLTNTKPYPVILSMNYDGTYKWVESVFTLWKKGDTGSLEWIWKRSYTANLHVAWWWTKAVTGQCHTWLINWKKQERCYKEVK